MRARRRRSARAAERGGPGATPAAGQGNGSRGNGPLAALGLSHCEEAAYELLVDRPAGTLAELAAEWIGAEGLPEVLPRLEAKGLIIRIAGGPERFEAVDPDVALDALVLSAEERLHRLRERARQLAELHRAHLLETGRGVVELVTGRQALRQRVAQVQRAARVELRCLDRPPYVDSRGTADTELELLARGVACRTVYDRTAVELEGTLADVERLAQAGGQGRVLPGIPMKLYLADDRLALLPLRRQPTEIDSALVIHPSGLLDALGNLFEGLWQRALPLGLPAHPATDGPARPAEPDRQRLVALLLSGLTDQAIARQLGVGYRTAQRRIARLMDELDASTRFQAGVQAAIRGRRGGRTGPDPGAGVTGGMPRPRPESGGG